MEDMDPGEFEAEDEEVPEAQARADGRWPPRGPSTTTARDSIGPG